MKLTVLERLMILGLLPAEGDILFLRVRQEMIAGIGLDAEEIERYEFKHDPAVGNATWRNDLPQEKEIELSDVEQRLIKDNLVRLNKESKLTVNHVSLYERFVEEK